MNDFTAEFFTSNRATLKRHIDNEAPIVITANGLVQRAGDSGFAFRQDSNFWYLTGIDLPDALLVITSDTDYIILPERDPILDYFDGPINTEELTQISGIKVIQPNHDGWDKLVQSLKKTKQVNTCLYKGYDQRHSIYMNPSKPRLVSRLKKVDAKIQLNDVRPFLTKMRMIKQTQEIAAIQHAVDISVEAYKTIFKKDWFTLHKTEASVAAELRYRFALKGADIAYPSIVAGGKRACTLHYEKNNQAINSGELLLIDAGAEFCNYASDITRVYAPKGFSQKQRSVYKAVKDIQHMAIEMAKTGADIKKLDKAVEKEIGLFLKAHKLITKQEPSQIRKYYPHVVSHHMGLDVHDVADYSAKLKPGMVITIEPGIYIPEWNVGVRLEDDILITKQKPKVLSSALPV